MKKLSLLLSAFCIAIACSAQLKTYSANDANLDGNVDINDVNSVISEICGTPSPTQMVEAGAVTINPYAVDNSFITGTWYKTKVESATFNADGTQTYLSGYTYQFFPYQGQIVFYNSLGVESQSLRVWKIKSDYIVLGNNTPVRYYKTQPADKSGTTDGKEYVDLGLPSGTLWATCNVGATSPEDYGLYFAWGETTGYTSDTSDGRSFYWDNYKWMTSGQSSWTGCTKYTFADGQTDGCWYSNGTYVGTTVDGTTYTNLTKLESADDAATANWGSNWCMPTHAQQQELVNSSYTSTEWTTVNGVYGRKITSLSNGNSLFLPAAGYRCYSNLGYVGSHGYYWSSELNSYRSSIAWELSLSSSSVSAGNNLERGDGRSVRAVRSASQY